MGSVDIQYRGKPKMTMRDKIAAIIRDGKLQMITYEGIADAIIKALPDYEAQQIRVIELEAALKAVIGMLDDPTGNDHVRDMRGATIIARAVLKGGAK
jgi:hypothetical protein